MKNQDNVIIDLSQVQFISSAMLGRLVMAWMEANTRGAHLVLCGVSDTIREILRIAGLHQRFSIFSDVDSAHAKLSGI
jgi:anti-anti-sigma factor